MHQYLKAIGFGPIKKKAELKEILEQTRETFTHQMTVSYNEEADYCEFQKEYGQDVGITLCGELDDHDQFDMEYYFPYFQGSGVTTYADVSIEKRIEREQYVGICEDAKVGISLIFTMQNGVEYMKERQLGMMTREEAKTRKKLLSAARNGDQGAIETLTLEDMDIYSKVSRRLATEDVYSIVDSYFMPYGVECDLYSIMGEILAIRERENTLTGERLYQMKLDVNELEFDVCVPKKEVLGEPEIGRRFKGEIWLQGYVNF